MKPGHFIAIAALILSRGCSVTRDWRATSCSTVGRARSASLKQARMTDISNGRSANLRGRPNPQPSREREPRPCAGAFPWTADIDR